jgi:predicted enzyme related to lactoylglutathione lyase
MHLYGIRIFVDNLRVARRFYGQTLRLTQRWAMPEIGAVGYALGDVTLIVEEENPNGEDGDLIGRFVGASFSVADVEATYREFFDRGVHFTGPPAPQPWGGVLANFRDPAGNILTLVESPGG